MRYPLPLETSVFSLYQHKLIVILSRSAYGGIRHKKPKDLAAKPLFSLREGGREERLPCVKGAPAIAGEGL